MKQARESLKGRWGLVICTFIVYAFIQGLSSASDYIPFLTANPLGLAGIAPLIFLIFVSGPVELGYATFSLAVSRNEEPKLGMLFSGFKQNYWKSVGVMLLVMIFVILLMLLLIVPGIIAALGYALAFYILRDNPEIGVYQAIKKSWRMMKGYKAKLFLLTLIFLGLMVLCALPILVFLLWKIPFTLILGIITSVVGVLFFYPYMQITYAKFYEDVKANYADTE